MGMAVILRQTENYVYGECKSSNSLPPPHPTPRMWYQSNTALEKSLQLAQICPENGDIG